MIMLGLSFLAVYGLSLAQQQNQTNSALSTIISIVITLINIIISRNFFIDFRNNSSVIDL